MKYLEINGTTIPIIQIANVIATNNQVMVVDINNKHYNLFNGNAKSCNEYKTSLLALLELTEKITLPEVHWVDYVGTKEIAVGMAYKPTINYDGIQTEDFTLQSSQVENAKIQDKLIMGLKEGASDIIVTSKTKTDKITLNVVNKPLDVVIDEKFKGYVNYKVPIKAFDKYNKEIDPYYINYTSLNMEKFKVDNNGNVTGVVTGEGIILLEYNQTYYFKTISILPEPPKLQNENLNLKVDETNQQNIASPGFSNPEYISDKPNIATVTKDGGLITAKSVGTCKIICKFKTPYEVIAKEITLTVQPKAPAPENQNQTLKVGEIFKGSMPQKAGFSGVKWVSDNATFATVDQNSGLVTAKKHGTTNIRGKFTQPYETDGIIYKLTIQPKEPQVVTETSEIQVLSTTNVTLPVVDGFSGQFWESTDSTKAKVVEGTGLVTGVAEGQCEIKGYFTTPYKALAKKITMKVVPTATATLSSRF